MKWISLYSSLLLVIWTQFGCSPVGMAKRGLTELRGAHGSVLAIVDAPPGFCEGLSGIAIGRVSNTIVPVCSPAMHRTVELALRERAAEASAELDGSGQTCRVDVDITFSKKPGGVLALIGKGALLIGRAGVFDQNAKQVGDLIVVVASGAVRTTANEMAREFANVLLEYLEKRDG